MYNLDQNDLLYYCLFTNKSFLRNFKSACDYFKKDNTCLSLLQYKINKYPKCVCLFIYWECWHFKNANKKCILNK